MIMAGDEALRFTEMNGELVAVSDYIDALAQAALVDSSPEMASSRISAGITVASEDELRNWSPSTFWAWCRGEQLTEHAVRTIVSLEDVKLRNEGYSIAIVWKTGDELRRAMGWPLKELFIDIRGIGLERCSGDKMHGIGWSSKDLSIYTRGNESCIDSPHERSPRRLSMEEVSLLMDYCKTSAREETVEPLPSGQWLVITEHLIQSEHVDAEVLDLLAVMMHKTRNFEKVAEVSRRLILRFPNDPRGYYRAGAYYSHLAKSSATSSAAPAPPYAWKLAMVLYGKALNCAFVLQDHIHPEKLSFVEKLSTQAVQAILQCARHTEFDCVATEAEISDLPQLYWPLMVPWTARVRNDVSRAFRDRGEPDPSTLLSLDSRERMCFYSIKHNQFRKLPRFFRWITPFRMAVMSTPRNAEDIELLAALGINNVVTLTKEEPLPKEWFDEAVVNTFMPVSNYRAPTVSQVDNFFNLFEDSSAESATLVHCGGGKGRAGTFIACYLARYGFTGNPDTHPRYSSSNEVISIVRMIRPGSIETAEQERFIATFVKELWKRAETGGKLVLLPEPEPEDSSKGILQVEGHFDSQSCKLIVCCGIPGSGKSTVSSALARAGGWVVASQDESGSWAACSQIVFAAMRQNRPVIVDRCNPTARDRQEWIEMAALPKAQTICLFFDYEVDLCLQRANQRLDHPTLEAGRARTAVRSMQKSLQRPSMVEKFGAIVSIRSIAEANRVVECLLGKNTPNSLPQKWKGSSSSSSSRPTDTRLERFYKFPRTIHLMNFGSATRDDLIMTKGEADAFLRGDGVGTDRVVVTFEEKVDGANMGFSIDPDTGQIRAQNRSHFVTSKSHPQFKKLDMWVSNHLESLLLILGPQDGVNYTTTGRYILFGEWLQATHSIHYTHLPDYFLAFDIYDAVEGKFWSRERFDKILRQTSIHSVPRIPTPDISEDVLQQMMDRTSTFYDGPIEGVYVRRDVGPFLLDRAKVVRKDFISGNKHWSKHISTNNIIRCDVSELT